MELVPATREQQPLLANLLELYAHDFSEFHHLDLGPDGRFGYPRLPLYWTEPGRHPFLIQMHGKPAGLALVKQGSEISGDGAVWDMAEFFIVRAYRRHGLGKRAAHEVFRRFPGPWEVRVMQSNRTALEFWPRAIAAWTGEKTIQPLTCEKNGKLWSVFAFHSDRLG